MNENQIRFERLSKQHVDIIFSWLDEPHMKEFWDNSQEHRDDILHFVNGLKQTYFCGTFHYWIGYTDAQPFAFLLSDEILASQEMPEIFRTHLSKSGHTVALDFGVGNNQYLGKGLAASTLIAFMEYYRHQIDPVADTFFIDPDAGNLRAIHVYEKAGFRFVGEFTTDEGAFVGHKSLLMIKKYNGK
jgi:RimJ/RimL family protein N-acetyltransferase